MIQKKLIQAKNKCNKTRTQLLVKCQKLKKENPQQLSKEINNE